MSTLNSLAQRVRRSARQSFAGSTKSYGRKSPNEKTQQERFCQMKLSSNRHRRLPIWEATKSMCSQAIPRWSDEVFRILGLVVCQDFVERIVHPEDLRDHLMKSVIAGITVWGASSISQCPEPVTTWPRTSDATSLACSIRKLPLAFSPVRTSIGIARRVVPI